MSVHLEIAHAFRKLSDKLDEIERAETMSGDEVITAISTALWNIAQEVENEED